MDNASGVPLIILTPAKLTPNCLATWRCISEMRTFSITCSPSDTDSMLTHLLGVARETGRQIGGAGGFQRAGNTAGQHHIVIQRRDLDRRIGKIGPDHRSQVGDIPFDANVEREHLMPVAVKEESIGLAGLGAEQEDAAWRLDHRVGDLGAGNQDILGIIVELDDRRFVEAQGQC